MKIKHLELDNFRNYESLALDLCDGINLFYGDNAQGKTNILEAVYLCGTTKSHRGSKEKEMIRFGQESSRILMEIERNDSSCRIDMNLYRTRKRSVFINRIPVKKAARLLEMGHYVFFSPEDLKIVKNGPAERRRFMDLEICQLKSSYIHDLASYNHLLMQRSSLLRESEMKRGLLETLPVWDDQLVRYGERVIKEREAFIDELNKVICPIHEQITGGREEIKIIYEKNVQAGEFEKKLSESREKDIKYKGTSCGPHRDDLMIISNKNDLRKYGSQGQQRTAALSLKLAEINMVKSRNEIKPVLLLDDVLSELDTGRQQYLLNNINDIQTLVTCTGMDSFEKAGFHVDRSFHVSEGRVINIDGGLNV